MMFPPEKLADTNRANEGLLEPAARSVDDVSQECKPDSKRTAFHLETLVAFFLSPPSGHNWSQRNRAAQGKPP